MILDQMLSLANKVILTLTNIHNKGKGRVRNTKGLKELSEEEHILDIRFRLSARQTYRQFLRMAILEVASFARSRTWRF
uniref:Uncharacterized protein n=1 Tax=Rhizophora mucronata TaxID=61149 RepID=A0A2P2NCU1_RHIMU